MQWLIIYRCQVSWRWDGREERFSDGPADTGVVHEQLTQSAVNQHVLSAESCSVSVSAVSLNPMYTEKSALCFLSWEQDMQYISTGKGKQSDLVLNSFFL